METKLIIDAITGEVTERPLNEEELAQRAIDLKNAMAYAKELNDKEIARQALFYKLGITEEEAKLLLS